MPKNFVSITTGKALAATLQHRRKDLDITQKELAAFCDLSHNGISRIEIAGSDIKFSTLLKISKMLGFKIVFELEE